jgi:Arc/MetJ-type ribon-helix-helix transcriptional regulator
VTHASVTLPDELLNEVDELVGEEKRSEFIADATKRELRRLRRIEIARQAGGSLIDADTPPEWETPEGTLAWVRSLRQWSDPWESARDPDDEDRSA